MGELSGNRAFVRIVPYFPDTVFSNDFDFFEKHAGDFGFAVYLETGKVAVFQLHRSYE